MSENLFEKIDKQSETIDSVAEKLNGVSIDDLYALAKRTWDYRDYQMAQKYYNHISLLRPLDWKAPFYASLCGCMGPLELAFWDSRPSTVFQYYNSTVDYILNRGIPEQEKGRIIGEIVEITESVFKEYIRIYTKPGNEENFDEYAPAFKRNFQKSFIDIIRKIDEIPFIQTEIKEKLCLECGGFIEKYCQGDKSISIAKEDFEKYILPYNDHISYEEPIYEEHDPEKEKAIKLKGKCYLIYKDKVHEKRFRAINATGAVLLLLSTCFADVIPMVSGTSKWATGVIGVIIVALLLSVKMLACAFGHRKGFRFNSVICGTWGRYRLSSTNTLVHEDYDICRIMLMVFLPYTVMMFNVLCFSGLLMTSIGNTTAEKIVTVVSFLVQTVWVGLGFIKVDDKVCRARFEYQGKTYYFDT